MSDYLSELRHDLLDAHERHGQRSRLGRAKRLARPRIWRTPALAAAASPAASPRLPRGRCAERAGPPPGASGSWRRCTGRDPADAATGFGSLWVTDYRGAVLRVDPARRRVQQRIRWRNRQLDRQDRAAVWVMTESDVLAPRAPDPHRSECGQITARVPFETFDAAWRPTASGLGAGQARRVAMDQRVDPATGSRREKLVPTPGRPASPSPSPAIRSGPSTPTARSASANPNTEMSSGGWQAVATSGRARTDSSRTPAEPGWSAPHARRSSGSSAAASCGRSRSTPVPARSSPGATGRCGWSREPGAHRATGSYASTRTPAPPPRASASGPSGQGDGADDRRDLGHRLRWDRHARRHRLIGSVVALFVGLAHARWRASCGSQAGCSVCAVVAARRLQGAQLRWVELGGAARAARPPAAGIAVALARRHDDSARRRLRCRLAVAQTRPEHERSRRRRGRPGPRTPGRANPFPHPAPLTTSRATPPVGAQPARTTCLRTTANGRRRP